MELSDYFSHPSVIWFLIGLILLVAEFAVPGLVIIFFGIGAWITALLYLLFEPSLNVQLIIFISTSLTSLFVLRKKFSEVFTGKKLEGEKDFDDEFIGRTAVCVSEITPEKIGKVTFKGTNWEAISDEKISVDEHVQIENKQSIQLKVKKIRIN